ncbi:MAG: EamA family transporter [Fibrobacteres bacterium]|nr:EamA family transporter [Fibrobacterota bacterium]
MSTTGIILVILSAFTHASWNVVSKRDGADPTSYFIRALFWCALLYLPLFIYIQTKITYTSTYSVCLTLSALGSGFYFLSLGKAYEKAPVSIVYPIARTFPILVVTWAGLFLNEKPEISGLIGIIIIVAGCFVLPLPSLKPGSTGISLKLYLNSGTMWALLSALFTSAYSMADKVAAKSYAGLPTSSAIYMSINYVYIQNAVSLIFLYSIQKLQKKEIAHTPLKYAIPSGLVFLVSYFLVMLAMRIDSVAYVVSLRQISIVIAAIVSMVWLEKKFSLPRFIGSATVFAGACIISFWG